MKDKKEANRPLNNIKPRPYKGSFGENFFALLEIISMTVGAIFQLSVIGIAFGYLVYLVVKTVSNGIG